MKSGNRKTGKIPVSITGKESCPDACSLKDNGCYANYGILRYHWHNFKSITWKQFIRQIKSLPDNQLWRHNQAGDLMGSNDKIDAIKLKELVKANSGKKGFTYTHYPLTAHNKKLIKYSNDNGFVINLSADSLHHADKLMEANVGPVVTILPSSFNKQKDESLKDYKKRIKGLKTDKGHDVIVCPAYNEHITCETCKLCAMKQRPIIAFPAHGSGKGKVDKLTMRIK